MLSVFDELGWRDFDKVEEACFDIARDISRTRAGLEGHGITAQEKRVIEAVSHGVGNKGAAQILGLSEETIKSHLKHASIKLKAKDGRHLVANAMRAGIIS